MPNTVHIKLDEPKYGSIPSASKFIKQFPFHSKCNTEHRDCGSYLEYSYCTTRKTSENCFMNVKGPCDQRHLGIEEGFCSFWPSKGIRPPAMEGGKVIGISNFEIS